MPRLNIEVRDVVYKKFIEQAEEDGRSVSDIVRAIIIEWTEGRIREKYELAKINKGEKDDGRDAGTICG